MKNLLKIHIRSIKGLLTALTQHVKKPSGKYHMLRNEIYGQPSNSTFKIILPKTLRVKLTAITRYVTKSTDNSPTELIETHKLSTELN